MKKVLLSVSAIVCFFMWLAIMLIFSYSLSGAIQLGTVSGWGVDSFGKIYIAMGQDIKQYHNNELLNEIDPLTDRGYVFSVHDDQIIVMYTNTIFVLSTAGRLLCEEPKDTYCGKVPTFERTLYAADAEYRLHGGTFGRYFITRSLNKSNNIVVFRESAINYLCRIGFIILPMLFIGIVSGWVVHFWDKKNKHELLKSMRRCPMKMLVFL